MRDDLEAADGVLETLYQSERTAPLPAGAVSRVLAGSLASIAANHVAVAQAGAIGGAGKLSTMSVVALAAASALLGAVVGVVASRALDHRATQPTIAPLIENAPAPAIVPPSTDAGVIGFDAHVTIDAASERIMQRPIRTQPAEVEHAVVTPTAATTEDDESSLVDRARDALSHGAVDDALTTLMRHAREFPNGALAEERDVLLIEGYLARGDRAIATRRIELYRRDYPNGLLRSRVDGADTSAH